MNLAEAKRHLNSLRDQAFKIDSTLRDPFTVQRVGTDRWEAWKKKSQAQLSQIHREISRTRRIIESLESRKRQERQERLRRRQEALEEHSDPSLSLLGEAFQLLITLRGEGVDFDSEETALVDQIGVHLKESLGLSSRGREA